MAAETTRKSPEIDAGVELDASASGGRGVSDDRGVLDLTGLHLTDPHLTDPHLREAPEAQHVDGLLEVDVPRQTEPTVETPTAATAVRFLALVLAGLFAPLAVLVLATSLPVASALQGAVLVTGWTVLGIAAHRYTTRRRR